MKTHFSHAGTQKGFSLLLGVLVGSLLISVGLGIFSLTLKESIISTSGKESGYALYAADSGIECALYYDLYFKLSGSEGIFGAFGTSTAYNNANATAANIECNGGSISSVAYLGGSNGSATTTIVYMLPPNGTSQPCVVVNIQKYEVSSFATNGFYKLYTIIQAQGYNDADTGGTNCGGTNPRRVERGLFIRYGYQS
jgi:hypothetical protein